MNFYTIPRLMFFISFSFNEVSHIINGRRTLSTDQSQFLQRPGFSTSKRESSFIVACKPSGDNLLCSAKKNSLVVMGIKKQLQRCELQIRTSPICRSKPENLIPYIIHITLFPNNSKFFIFSACLIIKVYKKSANCCTARTCIAYPKH